MLLRVPFIMLLSCAAAAPACAATCTTSLNGALRQIDYSVTKEDVAGDGQSVPKAEMKANTSLRERLFGRWGEVDCPAYLTLREFTPGLTDAQRKPFCLIYDKDADTYTGFSEGERNAYLVCKKHRTFCERVNTTKDEARSLASKGLDMARRSATGTARAALTGDVGEIIGDSSGALIVKGSGAFIAEALGATGTTIGTALSAPAVVATGAVTLVGVGGAIYFCR
jgi:hypothetical protein